MGITHLLPLSPPSPLYSFTLNPTKIPKFQCCYSSRRPVWDPDRDPFPFQAQRAGFGPEGGDRRRNWWSDDDDDDDDGGFGFWEEPSNFDWVFKVLRAFGWMIPAVLMATQLGTGSDSMVMALVLPLGQTALSLVFDKLWGDPSPSPKPKPRSRTRNRPRRRRNPRPERNPFVETAYEKSRKSRTRSYQSWGRGNSSSGTKGTKSSSEFGGWDELDLQ